MHKNLVGRTVAKYLSLLSNELFPIHRPRSRFMSIGDDTLTQARHDQIAQFWRNSAREMRRHVPNYYARQPDNIHNDTHRLREHAWESVYHVYEELTGVETSNP